MWPLVIERNQYGTEKCYDIPSRLLMDRIILLNEVIDSYTATSIIGQLLFLEKQDETAPVTIYINSPGGSISDGFASAASMCGVVHTMLNDLNTKYEEITSLKQLSDMLTPLLCLRHHTVH